MIIIVRKEAGCEEQDWPGLTERTRALVRSDDLVTQGRIEPFKDYLYTAKHGQCKFDEHKVVMTDAGHVLLHRHDETKLPEALVKIGPI